MCSVKPWRNLEKLAFKNLPLPFATFLATEQAKALSCSILQLLVDFGLENATIMR
jgi:hypothetical protein